jgi:dephospho-CoA kinase
VIFIDAPRDQRLARLAEGRGWTESTLEARERAQLPLDQKRRRADEVVLNDAGPEVLEASIGRLWEKLEPPDRSDRAHATGRRSPAPPPR